MIAGIGPNAEIHVNAHGGKQSRSYHAPSLVPAGVFLEVAEVLKEGADKYGIDNWQRISVREHLDHALTHIYAFIMGDVGEKHLVNATCRLMFARFLESKCYRDSAPSDIGDILGYFSQALRGSSDPVVPSASITTDTSGESKTPNSKSPRRVSPPSTSRSRRTKNLSEATVSL
jgi:hypothetical protein